MSHCIVRPCYIYAARGVSLTDRTMCLFFHDRGHAWALCKSGMGCNADRHAITVTEKQTARCPAHCSDVSSSWCTVLVQRMWLSEEAIDCIFQLPASRLGLLNNQTNADAVSWVSERARLNSEISQNSIKQMLLSTPHLPGIIRHQPNHGATIEYSRVGVASQQAE